jgi:hypothetical protein
MKRNDKWRCASCGMIVYDTEMLVAPSPFSDKDTVVGCPNCKAVDELERACDHMGCTNLSTAGTPYAAGYKFHCHHHPPSKDAREAANSV